MLKKILNIDGVQTLNEKQQQSIHGSGQRSLRLCCDPTYSCCNSGNYNPCQYVFGTRNCI